MAFKEKVGVFETYDRARNGPKVDEKEWDRKITYKTANKLKEKYKLKFDRSKIIPTDTDMIDRLYQAGLEMLVEMGVFCMDTGRVIKYTEDEVLMAVAGAPRELTLGEGRDARRLTAIEVSMIPAHPLTKVDLPGLLYRKIFLFPCMRPTLASPW
jgi:methylamine--corrinoid protein Co-methyltransferase